MVNITRPSEAAMARRRYPNVLNTSIQLPVQIWQWLLRILVPLNGHWKFVHQNGFDNPALATALGMTEWVEPQDKNFDAYSVRQHLRTLHQEFEQSPAVQGRSSTLTKNINKLAKLVELSRVDRRILEFSVCIHSEVSVRRKTVLRAYA
jgi:hypothetical protein